MNKKGFTLIEIIIVLAVLAILISAAFISFNSIDFHANDKVCKSNMRSIRQGSWVNAHVNSDDILEVANAIISEENTEYFPDGLECPKGGEYSASIDEDTGELIISCSVHGEISEDEE